MQLFAVNFIPLPGSLYMFRAFYAPIIRSTILTVSTASGTNHIIVSATFFQRGLVATLEEYIEINNTHNQFLISPGSVELF
jgi:hypothetical protein